MGTLYIVSTPIGNLGDITFRAVETLKTVDYVLCEDTRVTGKLLKHFEITKRMEVINDFNEERVIPKIIADLGAGKSLALVSDAGTPLVSDPGYKLVRECFSKNIDVLPVTGPTAAIAALTISGLPTDKFLFLGFLPKKEGKRLQMLKDVKEVRNKIKQTIIIYESPFRVIKTLEDLKNVFGDVDVAVCREITKIHEEVLRGNISQILELVKPKGEFVILF